MRPHEKDELRTAWRTFVKGLTEAERKTLAESGFNIGDPLDENLARFHRTYADTAGIGRSNEPGNDASSYANRIYGNLEKMTSKDEPDPALDYAVVVAARVIDAFDCSVDRCVRLHADCMRLAIGSPWARSQAEVSQRYGVSKASVSFRVRKIQKVLDLPRCFANGNRTGK